MYQVKKFVSKKQQFLFNLVALVFADAVLQEIYLKFFDLFQAVFWKCANHVGCEIVLLCVLRLAVTMEENHSHEPKGDSMGKHERN